MNRIAKASSIACLVASTFGAGCSGFRGVGEGEPIHTSTESIDRLNVEVLSRDSSLSPAELAMLPVVVGVVNDVEGGALSYQEAANIWLLEARGFKPGVGKYSFMFEHEGESYCLEAEMDARFDPANANVSVREACAEGPASGSINEAVGKRIFDVLEGKYYREVVQRQEAEELRQKELISELLSFRDLLQSALETSDDPLKELPTLAWEKESMGSEVIYSAKYKGSEIVIVAKESELFGGGSVTYKASIHLVGDEPFGMSTHDFETLTEHQWGLRRIVNGLDSQP